jgi:hypothetical protein
MVIAAPSYPVPLAETVPWPAKPPHQAVPSRTVNFECPYYIDKKPHMVPYLDASIIPIPLKSVLRK